MMCAMLKSLVAAMVVYGSLCFGAAATQEAIELAPNDEGRGA